jgi:hypothetical protein
MLPFGNTFAGSNHAPAGLQRFRHLRPAGFAGAVSRRASREIFDDSARQILD